MKTTRWLGFATLMFALPACHALDYQPASALHPGAASSSQYAWYSEAELDQLLAPVALYPDAVLSNILIAATYPLEIVEADRWLRNNPGLDADTALRAVQNQPWDDSVKSLVAFPQLLTRLSDDLQWTQNLGDAFLVAEADVMDRIQVLRMDARRAGQLRSTEQVHVIVERETVIIEPVVERIVHLPYYDTRVVYGNWRWHNHPPVYWTPLYPTTRVVHSSFYWGPPVHVRPRYVSAPVWSQRQVVVVNQFNFNSSSVYYSSRSIARHPGATRWTHQPQHRRGVAYHPRYQARHQPRYQAPPRNTRGAQARREATAAPARMPRYASNLAPPPRQRTGQVQQRQQQRQQQRTTPRRQQTAPTSQRQATVTRSARGAIEQYQRHERIEINQREVRNRSNSHNQRNQRSSGTSMPGWAPSQREPSAQTQGRRADSSRQQYSQERRQEGQSRQRAQSQQRQSSAGQRRNAEQSAPARRQAERNRQSGQRQGSAGRERRAGGQGRQGEQRRQQR
jgi:hypothetical protein